MNFTTGGFVVKLDLFTKSWFLDMNTLIIEFPFFTWGQGGGRGGWIPPLVGNGETCVKHFGKELYDK